MKKWLPVFVITALLALFATAPSWSQAVRATLVTFGGTGQPVTQSGTWTVQPGNTANSTAWKVDGSAVTQPVSGTVTANLAAGTNNIGDVDVLTLPSVTIGTFPDNEPFNIAQMNGVAVTMGNGASGTGVQRVTLASDSTGVLAATQSGTWTVQPGNTANSTPWLVTDGATSATGSAPPAKAGYLGGVTSGATGGLLGGITTCDSQAYLDMTTATTTELVALTASRKVYVCYWLAEANGTTVMTFKRGTGTNCGTGTTTISNAWDLVAQVGFSGGGGLGAIFDNQNAGDALCVTSSAAVNLHVYVRYAKY